MTRAPLAPDDALPVLNGIVPPWPGVEERLDGAVTYVRRTPAAAPGAEPALYVHGLGGSSLNWTDLAALLADRLDGEAIDLPGFGFSDPAPRYSLDAMSARVARWIEHSGRGQVHLFGNSLGGTIAVRVAATRPDLVRTLTLISPALPFLDPRRSVHARLLPLLLVPGADRIATRRLASVDPAELARQVIAACFAQPQLLPEQRLAEAVEEVRRRYEVPWYARAYLGSMRSLISSFVRAYLPGAGSMWRVAARITAPTLVISGRLDRIVDIRSAPTLGRLIPDSRMLLLDGVGHVAQMEQPRLVARAFVSLLADTGSRVSLLADTMSDGVTSGVSTRPGPSPVAG
jgi:pimeloyl-ACP methyl ester carboxylesterase